MSKYDDDDCEDVDVDENYNDYNDCDYCCKCLLLLKDLKKSRGEYKK